MEDKFAIQLFKGNKVRVVWDEEQEKYFFSVVDIIQVLTDSVNPTDYIKKMKSRDKELAEGWGQIVTPPPPLAYRTAGGKQKINFANLQGIFRIIKERQKRRTSI